MHFLNTAFMFILPCIFGGLGAVCRCAMTKGITRFYESNIPVATLWINCIASFALGVASNLFLALHAILGMNLVFIMVVGFLGGYSTFSTAIFEGAYLVKNRRFKDGIFLIFAELILPFLAATLGYVGTSFIVFLF